MTNMEDVIVLVEDQIKAMEFDGWDLTFTRELISQLRTERAAREEAEQLAVWAVENGVESVRDSSGPMIRWRVWDVGDKFGRSIHHDGTDAGILAALRKAKEMSGGD